jgi:hypothetical protein
MAAARKWAWITIKAFSGSARPPGSLIPPSELKFVAHYAFAAITRAVACVRTNPRAAIRNAAACPNWCVTHPRRSSRPRKDRRRRPECPPRSPVPHSACAVEPWRRWHSPNC